MPTASPRVLVTGATGYVGGRLVPQLLEAGFRVRCLARSPEKLAGSGWADRVEVVQGDLLDAGTLDRAFAGVDAAFYMVHSMGQAEEFADADRRAARNAARAAADAGVSRIVYLGGLGEVDERTSRHLASRAEVAEILRDGATPVTVLRAAVVIGSGSASFEMLRHLVEKLPIMTVPRWVRTRVQPIAIRDVLRYLVGVLGADDADDHVYDIGGPDVLTYLEMMHAYARVAGLPRRLVVGVPVLTPSLSSHWVNLVTPVPFGVARPLISSLTNEVVCRPVGEGRNEDISAVVPGAPIGFETAVELALARIRDGDVDTSWRDAELVGRSPAEPYPGDPDWTGGTLLKDVHTLEVDAAPQDVFRAVARIGGDRGWPTFMWAWRFRGRLDRLIGGVGLRRGRRHPEELRVGDALDFWRVEDVRTDEVIRLHAEMRLPGRAWLEFRFAPHGTSGTLLTQRALFAPRGLFGRLYWFAMLPFHALIFGSMIRRLGDEATELGMWRDEHLAG